MSARLSGSVKCVRFPRVASFTPKIRPVEDELSVHSDRMYGMKQTTDEGKVMRTTRDTKAMFANELEEMMQTMPLSKVRVADLCGRCCVERVSSTITSGTSTTW